MSEDKRSLAERLLDHPLVGPKPNSPRQILIVRPGRIGSVESLSLLTFPIFLFRRFGGDRDSTKSPFENVKDGEFTTR